MSDSLRVWRIWEKQWMTERVRGLTRVGWGCLLLLVAVLQLAACRDPGPGPETDGTATRTLPSEGVTVTADEPVADALTREAEMTMTAVSGLSPTATVTAAATGGTSVADMPCDPPQGWLAYTVQSGDTLYFLAGITGTTVEIIRAGNCLPNDFLQVGQPLYLPSLPPVAVSGPVGGGGGSGILPTAVMCFFECPLQTGGLPRTTTGIPNAPDICQDTIILGEPYIDTVGRQPGSRESWAYKGSRLYFFACNFAASPVWQTISLVDPLGSPVNVERDPVLFPDWVEVVDARTSLVLAWDVFCDVRFGDYRLRLTTTTGETAELTIHLPAPEGSEDQREFILTVPQVATPGQVVELYFCGYEEKKDDSITVSLSFIGEQNGQPWKFPVTSRPVEIDNQGSGYEQILLPFNVRTGFFILEDEVDEALDGIGRLMIIPLE